MSSALVLASGIAVKITGKNHTLYPTSFSISGALLEFSIADQGDDQNSYLYISEYNFLKEDKEKARSGYCNLAAFKDYVNNPGGVNSFLEPENWFDNTFNHADLGDLVTIKSIEFLPPFTAFCRIIRYSFKIKDISINFLNPKYYPEVIIEDESSPHYNVVIDESVDLLNVPVGKFYTKNFGSKVITWADTVVSIEEKHKLSELMTSICFWISEIEHSILKEIAINDLNYIKEAVYLNYIVYVEDPDNILNFYNDLPDVDKAIGQLLKDWGYIQFNNDYLPPSELLTTNTINEFSSYEINLSEFFNSLIHKKDETLFKYDIFLNPTEDGIPLTQEPSEREAKDSQRRIRYLLKVLSPSALALFPVNFRISWLDTFIEQKAIGEEDERLVVALVHSFVNNEDADVLLNHIVKIRNGGNLTNFEILYNKIDDASMERVPLIEWFVDHYSNKKYFIYSLYEAWKISTYNFYYLPPGVNPNDDGINPNSFFLSESGNIYYAKYNQNGDIISGSDPILEFTVVNESGAGNNPYYQVLGEEVYYIPRNSLEQNKIVIDITKAIYTQVTTPVGTSIVKDTVSELYGKYHLYQPIALLGYEADLDLAIPQSATIPAFLFKYAYDYDKIKDFDAAIAFGVEVAVEAGLFFATGGASIFSHLRHLRHLKHITKINKVKAAYSSMTAGEAVLFWRGILAAEEVTAVSASVLYSFFNYQAAVSNNVQLAELNRNLSYFFLALTFASAGKAIYSRSRAIKSADNVLDEIDSLSDLGIAAQVPDEVMGIVNLVASKLPVKITVIINSLATDYPQLASKLLTIKNSNIKLASELCQIISQQGVLTKAKFNANPNILDLFDDLTKVQKFKRFSGFYDWFYEVARLQKEQKFDREIFSELADVTNLELHSMEDVLTLVNHGFDNNLNLDDLYGLMTKSYRIGKQESSTVVVSWINNYKNFLTTQVPYTFVSASHFNSFKSQLGLLFSKYKLGDNVTIGGSSLTKLNPPDLDLVLYLSNKDFDDLLNHYQEVLDKIKLYKTQYKKAYSSEIKSIEQALIKSKNSGKIDTRCMVDFKVENGQPKLRSFISDLKSSSFVNDLNVSSTKKLDFNIFKSASGNRSISLPPEFKINL